MADDVPEAVLAVYDKLAAVAEQVCGSQEVADGVREAVVAGRNA